MTDTTTAGSEPGRPLGLPLNDQLGLVEPAGFRTRYRSEPGMIGHYPWTYADQRRRRVARPECETEDLYTADQVRAMLAAERERCGRAYGSREVAMTAEIARLRERVFELEADPNGGDVIPLAEPRELTRKT